jgi:Cu+-exporting ATPase
MEVKDFEEYAGAGIRGKVDGSDILLGSDSFVCGYKKKDTPDSTKVFLKMDGQVLGFFEFSTRYREGLKSMVDSLNPFYDLELMSGDNDAERSYLSMVFGAKAQLQFNLKPAEKMEKVANLKSVGKKVMMIGDGLNDAGALQSSDVGVAISDDTNTFSPSCDAILDGSSLYRLPALLKFSKWNKRIIIITFCISLFYNIVGLFFAVQGALSPVVAAILMPISSISIVLLTTGLTFLVAKIKKLI